MADDPKQQMQRVKAIFNAALDVPEKDREAFLRELCGDDDQLLSEIRELITHAGQTDGALKDPIAEAAAGVAATLSPFSSLSRIGPYKLLRLLGEGGMGAVYLARRADGAYRQDVAVKFLTTGWLSESATQRFVAERQILATLNHPNIARLLDGGTTDNGVPYLVMEFVDGVPIDRYCRANKMSTRERLELFQDVCGAVQYAHSNLVIHRDIKAANILVGDDGVCKLLDFGIAKLLDPELADSTPGLTRANMRLLTPESASPEQVRGDRVTTATDVYSLGVLLYQLVSGRFPIHMTSHSPQDVYRAILETTPERPSEAVARSAADAANGESARSDTSAARLKRELAGDLDRIALVALHKDPARRYPTVREFAEDIGRFLRHRPVLARPDSALYRARKFVRRHRIGVALTALVVALGIFANAQIVKQRDRARIAAAQSQQIAGFLEQLFASASPATAMGDVITATDLLEEGVGQIDTLADQPAVQSRLYDIMGNSYAFLGDHQQAIELFGQALTVLEQQLPDDLASRGNVLRNMADSYRLLENFSRSEQLFLQSLRLTEEAYGRDHGAVAYVLSRIGDLYRQQLRMPEARETLERAMEMKTRLGEDGDRFGVNILGNLALVYTEMGLLEKSESMQERALEGTRRLQGPKHPQTITMMSNLAILQNELGKYDKSLVNAVGAYELAREVRPTDVRYLIWAAANVGYVQRRLGHFREAGVLHEEMVQMARDALDPVDPGRVNALVHRGRFLLESKSYDKAREVLEEAIAMEIARTGERTRASESARFRIATALNDQGQPIEAERIAREVLQNRQLISATVLQLTRVELARSLSQQARIEEASKLFDDIIVRREEYAGADAITLINYLVPAARHYRRHGDFEKATAIAERAHRLGQTISPDDIWFAANATAEYGLSLHARRDEEAGPLLEAAHAALSRDFGPEDAIVRELHDALQALDTSPSR